MSRKVIMITVLMTACSSLLVGLQLYWNFHSYRSTRRSFASESNAALQQAVSRLMNLRRDEFAAQYRAWLADTNLVVISLKYRPHLAGYEFSIRDKAASPGRPPFRIGMPDIAVPGGKLTGTVRQAFIASFTKNLVYQDLQGKTNFFYTDSLGKRLADAFRRDRPDLNRLTGLYRAELSRFDLDFPFVLRVAPYKFRRFSAEDHQSDADSYRTRGYTYGFADPVYSLSAWFPQPGLLLFQKMKGVLLASVLLISITIACYAYTLKTMFSEKKLVRLKDDLVNNMTHELRTPVATIAIAAEAVDDPSTSPASRSNYNAIIRQQAGALSAQIDRILTSMVHQGKSAGFTARPVLFTDLMRQSLEIHQPRIDALNARIATTYPLNDHVVVAADADHLRNALNNLLDNALKYSTQPPEITIALTTGAELLEYRITNQGTAIPPEYHRRIFERFFRIPSAQYQTRGYGLGLSYVAQVVRDHKGSICLESTGSGNTFIIKLPIHV
ncbi:sensor histidine kinase [Hufsiella ginkgonis]|uniref:histidine kinase n=1 Tax=Hufsiella ginkgonis TaxID=2695274 RepID=A0A7K1XSY7_9SPHI|nr:HAMP domain-containing sensor histidine kinase [Hufsiella ginkgonis]MXV14064.1 hypothetical protein [Hufsiella ginkgonis]